MKKNVLAIILALCMVISMLPATAFAAHDGEQLTKLMVPATVGKLEPAAIEPNAKSYKVSLTGEGNGEVELLVDSPAQVGSEVYFVANPDDGYLAEVYYEGLDDDALVYVGADVIGFIMPANKVTLKVKFVEAEGSEHSIDVYESGYGDYALSRNWAKQYESVILAVQPSSNSSFDPEGYVWVSGAICFYLFEDEGVHYYELIMGDENVSVFLCYKRTGPYYISIWNDSDPESGNIEVDMERAYVNDLVTVTITPNPGYRLISAKAVSYAGDLSFDLTPIGNDQYTFRMHPSSVELHVRFEAILNGVTVRHGSGGTASANVTEAKVGDTVTITCTPDDNYRVYSITGVDGIVDNGDGTYSFTMPENAVTINVTFRKIYNPVTVTVDTGIGGTASADLTEAKLGDVVTLTCAPEEGYRVAQITGVSDLTDNGDNTYTFTMPDEAVELKVLFLRNENPFLDVNETHFFHDPVLWAVGEGITNGIDDTHFGPFLNTNRAAVVTMLWRYAGSPEPTTTENPFSDVPADSWYTKPVLWAVENGITNGISATEFGPNGICNRAQVVTFLYRAMKAAVPEGTENPFVDVEAGSWYEAPVLWALANGVTTGADATHFNPNGQCLRAQFVTFLYRTSLIPPTQYALSYAAEPAEGGEVALSHETAVAGETVTVTVAPAEGYRVASVTCESGAEVTQVSETEYTFTMPAQEEKVLVAFEEIPVEPTDPEEPDPTDPTEPAETYAFVLKDNGYGTVSYKDKMEGVPGESIFFYAIPNEGYYLSGVEIFNPDNAIDVSKVLVYAYEDNLYELVMIDHDVIMTCVFSPLP